MDESSEQRPGSLRQEDEFRIALGARVLALRQHRGWSQKQLSARMGGDFLSALSRCERAIAVPRPPTLVRLADALGVTMDLLLRGKSPSPAARAASLALADRLETLERLPPGQFEVLLGLIDNFVAAFGGPPGPGRTAR